MKSPQIAGRHARAVFRNEARVIEASTVLIERSHHPQLMLWVAWLVINSDGKISDDEALLMRQLVTLARDRHEIVDEAFAHLVDVDAAEVWRRIDAEPDDLTDIIEAAIKVAEIDGKMNGDEKQVVAELTERCHSAANPHPADVQAVAADLPKGSPPAIRAHRIEIAGQAAWVHDSHARGGTFHTYDQLTLDGDPYGWHKVHVWLPPAYSGGTSRHPVVFANDGQQVFFGGGIGQNWWIQEVVQQFPAAGTNETLPIIVGVDWRERSYEYLHKPITRLPFGLVKARLPFGLVELYRGGGLGPYSNYLADQIVPFIDSNYRTVRDRQHRVVLGSSHGGLAAFFTGVSHGDVFGQVIAMSPSFWAGTMKPLRKSTLYQWTVENLRRVETRPRIYIDWGLQRGGGYHNKFIEAWATSRGQDMRDILVHNHGYVDGVDLMAVADPDGEHDEDTWRRRLPGALRFALGT